MGILYVKHRIFGRLAPREVQIEIQLTVRFAEQKEESNYIGPDLIDEFIQGDVRRFSGRHLDLLTCSREGHELIDDRPDSGNVVPERLDRCHNLLMLCNMVGAKHIDYQIEAALQFVDMICNVRSSIC